MTDRRSRVLDTLTDRPGLVVVFVLLLTAGVGVGVMQPTPAATSTGITGPTSPEQQALEEIQETYGTDNTTVAQVVIRTPDGNALSRASLLEGLRLQRSFEQNETIDRTMTEQGAFGLENVVARVADAQDHPQRAGKPLTIDEQIQAVESRSPAEIERIIAQILGGSNGGGRDPTTFLPAEYEPGTTSADARVTIVTQDSETATTRAQLAMDALTETRMENSFVFGAGIVDEANSSAIGDSFVVITPIALVLLVLALAIAYRDLLDVLVSLAGVGVVMVLLAGIQGWLGIGGHSMLIAVPFLLVGLSIDYSLHIVMRYRQARAVEDSTRPATAMKRTLRSVGVALLVAGLTTAIGFFSNYTSSLPSIRDFALLSTAGIVSLVVVFTTFVPAVKLLLEQQFERLGRRRTTPAVGDTPGIIRTALAGIGTVTTRLPYLVVITAVLVAGIGAYGATGVDTEFNQADFIPRDAPAWMDSLPEPLAPDDYTVAEEFNYVSDTFSRQNDQATGQILLRGPVSDPATLDAIDAAISGVSDESDSTIVAGPNQGAITSPASVIRSVSQNNETVSAMVADRDTDGDGLPDRDVRPVYERLSETAPDKAGTVFHRDSDGSYDSARILVPVESDESASAVARDVRSVAETIEAGSNVEAVPTGQPVVTAVVQTALFTTMVDGFAVTIGVILVVLVGLYWWRHRRPTLGVLVLAPVVLALAWLLGTMALLDVPFNSETVVITSLAIGLGVDYSVHLSERFLEEREHHESTTEWITAGITGTGGPLLGSALTTAAGFGVLALALSPPLQRFGLVTALSIGYSFIACVTVLPALFVWRSNHRSE